MNSIAEGICDAILFFGSYEPGGWDSKTRDDFASETIEKIEKITNDFSEQFPEIADDPMEYRQHGWYGDPHELLGHDIALMLLESGSGFSFEYNETQIGNKAIKWLEKFRKLEPYEGDDGKIYFF